MSKFCCNFAPSFKKTSFGKLRRVGESSPFLHIKFDKKINPTHQKLLHSADLISTTFFLLDIDNLFLITFFSQFFLYGDKLELSIMESVASNSSFVLINIATYSSYLYSQ